ncbi:MAG TPA: hypothetical protein VKQ29_09440 [Aliidongia sp.]|nr:hypothetical protein [Aliidongia sp.]
MGQVINILRAMTLSLPIWASAAFAGASPLPASVERALGRATEAGDPAAIGQLVGGNPMLGAEIVAMAVTRRPDLAAPIAAAAAGNVPDVAPQLAAAVADPAAATGIATAVSVAVPAARAAVADAIVAMLPPNDRLAAATRIHAAISATILPSVDDPQ